MKWNDMDRSAMVFVAFSGMGEIGEGIHAMYGSFASRILKEENRRKHLNTYYGRVDFSSLPILALEVLWVGLLRGACASVCSMIYLGFLFL